MPKKKTKSKTESQLTDRARLILKYATEAKEAFRDQCDTSRQARRATGGALTHAEQDLLRAMVVFSAAGLDALLKQLIRDALQALAARDPDVQVELETFVDRQLRGDALPESLDGSSGRRFLARILAAPTTQERLIEEYIKALTGESLQSAEQVYRAIKALGIRPDSLELDAAYLKEVFRVRNEIIHEMDVSLGSTRSKARKRRSRTTESMTEMADHLLGVGKGVIDAVEKKLKRAS